MSVKSLMFLTSALVSTSMVIEPLAANAGGLNQLGTSTNNAGVSNPSAKWGNPAPAGGRISNLTCDGVPGVDQSNIRQMNERRSPGIGMSAFRPNMINPGNAGGNIGNNAANNVGRNDGGPIGGGNVSGSIGFSKPLNVFNRNSDGPGANNDGGSIGGRNFDNNNRGDNAGRGFGNFGGRQLNVQDRANSDNSQQQLNVDTGNSHRGNFGGGNFGGHRNFGSDQPLNTYGGQGAQPSGGQINADRQVDNSRLFGGSRRMNVEAGEQQRNPGFNASRSGGFDGSRKIDVDNASRFGGFGAGNRAGADNSRKIDANSSVAPASGNQIDTGSRFGGQRGSRAGFDASRQIDLTDILYHRHRETIALPPPDPDVVGQG